MTDWWYLNGLDVGVGDDAVLLERRVTDRARHLEHAVDARVAHAVVRHEAAAALDAPRLVLDRLVRAGQGQLLAAAAQQRLTVADVRDDEVNAAVQQADGGRAARVQHGVFACKHHVTSR